MHYYSAKVKKGAGTMIQITLPASVVTMLKESVETEKGFTEKIVKTHKTATIAEVLNFNSLKEDYFASHKECEFSLKKVAGI